LFKHWISSLTGVQGLKSKIFRYTEFQQAFSWCTLLCSWQVEASSAYDNTAAFHSIICNLTNSDAPRLCVSMYWVYTNKELSFHLINVYTVNVLDVIIGTPRYFTESTHSIGLPKRNTGAGLLLYFGPITIRCDVLSLQTQLITGEAVSNNARLGLLQFLFFLSSFNLTQHVDFPSHTKNHTLDMVIPLWTHLLLLQKNVVLFLQHLFYWSPGFMCNKIK